VCGGQLVITGGNNTGHFTQAPGIAQAVVRMFMGEYDAIHVLFNSDRSKLPGIVAEVPATSPLSPLMDAVSLNVPTKARLRLLVLCSNGPQHNYLSYRLDQAFSGYLYVPDTGGGQVQQLWQKGRAVDACWQAYHGWRRRLFGHDRP